MPQPAITRTPTDEAALGAAAAAAGYLLWGVSVIFYKQLMDVPPFEVLAHRSVWSVLLTAALIFALGRRTQLAALLADRRTMLTLLGTSFLIGSNWFVFIYSINEARIVETSLGYYVNPLVSVLLGVAFLGERLSRPQIFAVALAATGVAIFAWDLGTLPWISLYLAFSFAAYGYLRKVSRAPALEGLFVEVLMLLPLALAYLFWLSGHGGTGFETGGWYTWTFLVLTGPMTTVPLFLFTFGARRIRLTTLGLMQYLAPSTQFILAVFLYGEPLAPVQLATFGLIWVGLGIFSMESWRYERDLRRVARG
ncbi:MAG: EamA family transporter RarD [Alphaproteobacteria bacterium HGW-Alphaproteobacteria-12]|nr:MAG: EamA family transporter RarD [Alphaproteobacteria bacterium HGW-Alphaproteobacteria-12]